MFSAVVVFTGLFGLLFTTTVLSTVEVKESRRSLEDVKVKYLAESGVESGIAFLENAVKNGAINGPMEGLTNLFAGGNVITPMIGQAMLNGPTQVGAYTVRLTAVNQTPTSMTIQIDASGYLPDAPANLAPGEEVTDWEALSVTVEYNLQSSEVFNYSYFINNWGWFYGDTIHANGNARSNGQFDVAGYSPYINGQPLYKSVAWDGANAVLSGYQDDNEDGLEDGNDGGVFSAWDIVDAQNLRGTGSSAQNQHEFEDPIPMPNLTNLSYYEDLATANGGGIQIGGTQVSDPVFGDDSGETGNLYLVGTLADPIELDGPLVVQGNLIISGYVTGQGSIYAGGNVYVPDSIRYVNPPDTERPSGTEQTDTEAWLDSNWDKDFLGLFARENVVVGDHTNGTWRHYVSGWMGSSMNGSEEDAGEDGIPNTAAGRDGIMGTADDDVLEGDGVFTTEYYTAADLALGIIPAGKSVGDRIPGSGEDIDGDGSFDPTTTLADVDFTVPLDTNNWGGNMPSGGIAQYKDIATLYANNLDAVFYTNHSFCYLVVGSQPAKINGALVSRNENIIYGTPSIEINHDSRLLGGNSGLAGTLLPQVMQSPGIVRWQRLDRDPNFYAGVAP